MRVVALRLCSVMRGWMERYLSLMWSWIMWWWGKALSSRIRISTVRMSILWSIAGPSKSSFGRFKNISSSRQMYKFCSHLINTPKIKSTQNRTIPSSSIQRQWGFKSNRKFLSPSFFQRQKSTFTATILATNRSKGFHSGSTSSVSWFKRMEWTTLQMKFPSNKKLSFKGV